jgi:hypothetical protein
MLNFPSANFSIRITGFSRMNSVIFTWRRRRGSSLTPIRIVSAAARSVPRFRRRMSDREMLAEGNR